MELKVKKLNSSARLPQRQSPEAAGYDLYACKDTIIYSGRYELIGTGIAVQIPIGTYGRIASRSSLAANYGIQVGAGVIDSDYRGEIKVLLFNHGNKILDIEIGDRIGQLILEKIELPTVKAEAPIPKRK